MAIRRSQRAVEDLPREVKTMHFDANLVINQRNTLIDQIPPGNTHQRLLDLNIALADSAADIFVEYGPQSGVQLPIFSIGADSNDPSDRDLHQFLVRTDHRVKVIGVLKGSVLPTPGEVDDLVVNNIGQTLTVGNKEASGVLLSNNGVSDITIKELTPIWTPIIPTDALIDEIRIDGSKVWDSNGSVGDPPGLQTSGVVIDIEDTVIVAGDPPVEIKFLFNIPVIGFKLDCVFLMIDDSTKLARMFGEPDQSTRMFGELVFWQHPGEINFDDEDA